MTSSKSYDVKIVQSAQLKQNRPFAIGYCFNSSFKNYHDVVSCEIRNVFHLSLIIFHFMRGYDDK